MVAMGNGDDMQARVAVLEALAQSTDRRLGSIEADLRDVSRNNRSDFRLTWAGILGSFIILAGLTIQGYLLLQDDIRSSEQRLSAKIEATDQRMNAIAERIESIARAVSAPASK